MAGFADYQLDEIRSRADILEVIGAHVRLRQSGRNFLGLCPFHNEKTPSFTVNRERGFFHCFGCGAGGTVFNFLMRMEGMTFPEAVRSLAQRYGIRLVESSADPKAASEREAMLRAAEMIGEFYAYVLWQTPVGTPARQYLAGRGIEESTAKTFKLGFAPADSASLMKALAKRGLIEGAVKIGVLKDPHSRDLFAGRLIFPIRDGIGRVIGFGGRVLDTRLPKYINSPESPIYSKARGVYGLFEARQAIGQADRAIVVEGYLDAIALWQAGFKETVASLGTSLTVEQLRLLARYTANILACFDGDGAGHNASLRALRTFLEAGLLGRGIFIPQGFDPDTLVRGRGAAAFAELADHAQLLVEYFVESQAAQIGAGGLGARARAAENVAQILGLIHNPFEFDLLTRKAAEMLGLREEVLREQARKNAGRTQPPPSPNIARSDMLTAAEYGLLAIAAGFPQLRAEIATTGAVENFEDRQLAETVMELCGAMMEQGATEAYLAQHLSAEQQGRLSALILDTPMADTSAARFMLGEYTRALKRWSGQQEVRNLVRNIAAGDHHQAAAAAQAVIMRRRNEGKTE